MPLALAAAGEAATGCALAIAPSVVVRLLLGTQLPAIAMPVARVAGMALVGLAIACWPGPAIIGMVAYSGAISLYFSYLALVDGIAGIVLWPAVALHLVLTVILARESLRDRRSCL